MNKLLRRLFEIRAPMTDRATLYVKPECSLCRDAERVVGRVFRGSDVELVDITTNRELEDRFVYRIPVLMVGDELLVEGRITLADARRAKQRHFELQRQRMRAQ